MGGYNYTVCYPPGCLNYEDCPPNFWKLVELARVIYDTWFDRHCNCQPNGTTRSASDRLANFSILMFCVYTVIVALMIWARKLSTNWLICVGLLYVADSGTLMMFGRGAQLGCSISYRTDLNQFFNGIAGGQQDMLVSVNLLMAFLRSWEATHLMETMPLWIPILGAVLCVACGFFTFLLHILEVFGRVWFTPDAQGYHDENKFPAQHIRSTILAAAITTTAALYVTCAIKIVRMSPQCAKHQKMVLFTSLAIFVNQLIFLYASFWIGTHLGIVTVEFDAAFGFYAKPICASVAPLLYLCSSYVRSSLCCRLGEVRERAYSTIKMKTLPSPVHV